MPIAIAVAALPLLLRAEPDDWSWIGYPKIMTGAALALALHTRAVYDRLSKLLGAAGLISPVVAVIALQALSSQARGSSGLWHLAHSLTVAWIILACVAARPIWLGTLESRPMRFIGERSYGVYLVQLLVVPVAAIPFPVGSGDRFIELATFLWTALLCIVTAHVMRKIVEVPCIQVGHRLSNNLLNPPSQEPVPGDLPSGERAY